MFEYDQAVVDSLLEQDQNFSRLHHKHTDLKQQIDMAHDGKNPIDDLSLEQLKKEKLHLKDQMADMIRDYQRSQHA